MVHIAKLNSYLSDNPHYALVNQIPQYPPPGPMRGFDKGIDERYLP